MIAKPQVMRWEMLAAALMLAAAPQAWAQVKKAPTKKTTTAPPVVQPTASEGSTAIAARGRPVSTAAGRAVNGALRKALADANVRNAVRSEVLRQLRVRSPLAIVNGYLVSGIDLKPVYQAPGVRPALLASLGVNGPQLINEAGVSGDRLTIVFTPAGLGQIVLPEFMADITSTLGVDALRTQMTDFVVGPVLLIFVLAGTGFGLTAMIADTILNIWEHSVLAYNDYKQVWGPNADPDNDGLKNKDDPDDDGDGYNDDKDNYPHDASKHICDCGRPAASFSGSAAGDILPSLIAALNATQAQSARAFSLGALAPGRSNTLAVIF